MLRAFLIVPMLFCSFSIWAASKDVTIYLKSIEAVKTSEKSGDEIYFSVTQYSNQQKPEIFRVPIFPMHWLSDQLTKLKNVKLWEGQVNDDESVMLILSLIEQDLPPWDVDDHLGSAQVKLDNKNGKVSVSWGQPKFLDQPKVTQGKSAAPKYTLYGDGAEYVIEFSISIAE